eukprot:364352-Chlamydomonas_euryale.AAC.3
MPQEAHVMRSAFSCIPPDQRASRYSGDSWSGRKFREAGGRIRVYHCLYHTRVCTQTGAE